MINNNYDFHINRLINSPVYSMSLGSKELFHSNFWAFLIRSDEYRGLIKVFFPDFDLANFNYEKIEREDKNRDLTIYTKNGYEYVIENKIKSYPDKEQLIKYGKIKNFVSGVITGIKRPPFILDKWTFVSYSSVASKLRDINKTVQTKMHDLVEEYCDVLDSINALMEMSLDETKDVLLYSTNNIKKLDRINLMDVFEKNKADDFVKNGFGDLKSKYEELAEKKEDVKFYIERSFNNCKATLTFGFKRYIKGTKEFIGSNEMETIGVQIEGDQFRLYKWNRDMDGDDIFKAYAVRGWFDPTYDFKTNRTFKGIQTKMQKKYCKYGSNWIYQYFNLWIKNRLVNYLEYKELVSLIKSYLDEAFSLLN